MGIIRTDELVCLHLAKVWALYFYHRKFLLMWSWQEVSD